MWEVLGPGVVKGRASWGGGGVSKVARGVHTGKDGGETLRGYLFLARWQLAVIRDAASQGMWGLEG